MKKLLSLSILFMGGQAYAMKTLSTAPLKQGAQAALDEAMKGLRGKELLEKYAKVKEDAELAIRTFDEAPQENRGCIWLHQLVHDEWQKTLTFQTEFSKAKDAVKDPAKRDEIEINLAALTGRLENIVNHNYRMRTWGNVY